MGRPLEYNATVVGRTDLTDTLATFLIQPDQAPRRRPWFIAGQYCLLGLNNTEKPFLRSVRRAMSIASAPECDGPLEFYVRYVVKPTSQNPLTHLLWKLRAGDRIYVGAKVAGAFTINFLAADQQDVCKALARKDDDKFADIAWEPGPLGHPRIAGAVGYLDCTLHSLLPGGAHVIFTGFVSAAESNDAPPLIFHRGKFATA